MVCQSAPPSLVHAVKPPLFLRRCWAKQHSGMLPLTKTIWFSQRGAVRDTRFPDAIDTGIFPILLGTQSVSPAIPVASALRHTLALPMSSARLSITAALTRPISQSVTEYRHVPVTMTFHSYSLSKPAIPVDTAAINTRVTSILPQKNTSTLPPAPSRNPEPAYRVRTRTERAPHT